MSTRARKARLATHFGQTFDYAALGVVLVFFGAGAVLAWQGHKPGYCLLGLALLCLLWLTWVKQDLKSLKASQPGSSDDISLMLDAEVLGRLHHESSLVDLWHIVETTWQARFMMVRFGLHPDLIGTAITASGPIPEAFWSEAVTLAQSIGADSLSVGLLLAALVHFLPALEQLAASVKVTPADLDEGAAWLERMERYSRHERPLYGGVARDWAAGFTPMLDRFGHNLSREVERAGGTLSHLERGKELDSLVANLSSAVGNTVIIGESGSGKTSLLYTLADRILQGKTTGRLAHHQIIALNAALILSTQKNPGDIERVVLALLSEAARAGNIVLAFDEAQLFFGHGTGAVNLSQVLLPILQARHLNLIFAFTPGDWQRLRAVNSALSSLLTPLVLPEPSEQEVIRMLADAALLYEHGGVFTTYQSLSEAYRLAGRYLPDEAYPGRALKLLEASYKHPEGALITAASVGKTVEEQFGVKVQQATAAESDTLLHLEDKIHERMINQSRAVSVVASALRRARAGVANPSRPLGSFLFLGPTGVGKTELARSLAAVYYGSEHQLIRLDMSEYQQPTDTSRLLADASNTPDGFLSQVRANPFSVVLLDEIEKAHPNILNLLLQMLDEGKLTDLASHSVSFKDAIVIATSNAGAEEIRQRIEAGQDLESFEQDFTDQLINSNQFKPELLNRFDEIVLFRPLTKNELIEVVGLLIREVNHTLERQKIRVELTPAAAASLVEQGYDPRLGARPMRRMVQRRVEDAVAGKILRGEATPGSTISLDAPEVANAPTSI